MNIFFTIVTFCISNFLSAQHFNNELIILQNGVSKSVSTENDVITLKKQPFKIQFYSKFHHTKKENFNGLKVTVSNNQPGLVVIEEGTAVNLIPFFEEVSMTPTDDDGFYSAIMINDYSHHYLFYESETHKNVELISKKNEVGFFEWEVNRFYFEEKEFPIQQIKQNKLTFIFLNDYNSNKIIDIDELRILRVNFE